MTLRRAALLGSYNFAEQRKLLDTGEVVGPGGYVYEPLGNVDSWMAIGDEPVIVFVTVRGAVESLDEAGQVVNRISNVTRAETYRRYLAELG